MKFFVSCDMEGVTGVVDWCEVDINHHEYPKFRTQMTSEVNAVCLALHQNGVDDIVIKDAHDTGRNLEMEYLPEWVKVNRAFAKNPLSMMMGLDASFDGVIMTGYHDASFSDGNPLAHTMDTSKYRYIKINGEIASEFLFNAYIAAYYNVPVFAITGDQSICMKAKMLCPNIVTVPVKYGEGASCTSIHPMQTLKLIRDKIETYFLDFKHRPKDYLLKLPDSFVLEVCYTSHIDAYRAQFYPNVTLIDTHTVQFETDDYLTLLNAFFFIG